MLARMDNHTEQLADGVWRVELNFWLSAFVLANNGRDDADGLTLVDAGTRGAAPRLVRSVRMLGFEPRSVTDVLLTHWHIDHTGGARRFAESSAAPRVWIGAGDLPVLTGEKTPGEFAGDASALGRFLHRHAYVAPQPVADARTLADGHVHEAAGGARVVAAPGHTIGHVALHLPERGVLIAGDAVMNLAGLRPSPGLLSSARAALPGTLARLAALDFTVLAMMHGPPVERDARSRLQALAAKAA